MKKQLLISVLFLLSAVACMAQKQPEFSVVSFEEKPFDTAAKDERYKIVDGNGDLFSIIKLVSNNAGDDLRAYSFDFGLCESRVKQVDGDVWVYVQRNAMRATIKREGYKTVKYELNTTVQPGCVYEMVLADVAGTKYRMIRFNIEPSMAKAVVMCRKDDMGAEEYLLGYADENGAVARLLEPGTYSYRVLSDLFHMSEGRLQLGEESKTHTENVFLRPNFSAATLRAGEGVDIYVDEEKMATGEWVGALKIGAHRLGARKKGYTKAYVDVEIVPGNDTVIQLPALKPIEGALSVVSTPLGAKVFIDGKECGVTPYNINGLLIGDHTVEVIKKGYSNELREVEIVEDEMTHCYVTLAKGTSTEPKSAAAPAVGKQPSAVSNRSLVASSSKVKIVSGILLDKKNNPLSGATVQVVDGIESTMTDSDGTFAFEVPMALEKIAIMQNGYEKKVKRITSGEMVIRTRKATKWFINASAHLGMVSDLPGFPYYLFNHHLGLGLMFGQTKNWGWYTRVSVNENFNDSYMYVDEWYIEEHHVDVAKLALAVGVTKRLANPLYLYAGVGFEANMSNGRFADKVMIEGSEYPLYGGHGCEFDLGFLIKPTSKFNINLGATLFTDFEECIGVDLNLGFGVSF